LGQNLRGDDEPDATGCYVMPGGTIRIHTLRCRSWAPIPPTILNPAPARRWLAETTMVDFALPSPEVSCMTRCKMGQQIDTGEL
jgi:dihydropyrimidinase